MAAVEGEEDVLWDRPAVGPFGDAEELDVAVGVLAAAELDNAVGDVFDEGLCLEPSRPVSVVMTTTAPVRRAVRCRRCSPAARRDMGTPRPRRLRESTMRSWSAFVDSMSSKRGFVSGCRRPVPEPCRPTSTTAANGAGRVARSRTVRPAREA